MPPTSDTVGPTPAPETADRDTSATPEPAGSPPRRQRIDTASWVKRHWLFVHAGVVGTQSWQAFDADTIDLEVPAHDSAGMRVSGGYLHALHLFALVGANVSLSSWEPAAAEFAGYPSWRILDVVLAPKLRVPFGWRARGGVVVGPTGGVSFNFAPTGDALTVVHENAGRGVGWNWGFELIMYVYLGKRIGLVGTYNHSVHHLRHEWRFSSNDGSLGGATETIRYRVTGDAATWGLQVAL